MAPHYHYQEVKILLAKKGKKDKKNKEVKKESKDKDKK